MMRMLKKRCGYDDDDADDDADDDMMMIIIIRMMMMMAMHRIALRRGNVRARVNCMAHQRKPRVCFCDCVLCSVIGHITSLLSTSSRLLMTQDCHIVHIGKPLPAGQAVVLHSPVDNLTDVQAACTLFRADLSNLLTCMFLTTRCGQWQ
eukprot:1157572-Amphidinium_carterae.1